MALIVNNVSVFNNTSGGIITDLGSGSTCYVLAGVNIVQTNGGIGIRINGSAEVTVQGTVIGEASAIAENGDVFNSGSSIYVASTGFLSSGASGKTINLVGDYGSVINDGVITGSHIAVWESGTGSTLSNTGRITTDFIAVAMQGFQARLENSGTIAGTTDAVQFQNNGATLGNSGLIQGGRGIDGFQSALDIVNAATGHILGNGTDPTDAAILMNGGSSLKLANAGIVEGDGADAIRIVATNANQPNFPSTLATITNTGTIVASLGHDAISVGQGTQYGDHAVLFLTNAGLIQGDIDLQGGDNDSIDDTAGRLIGVAHLGTGDDTFLGGIGNETVYGDAGADSLNGGAGNDRLTGGADDDEIDGGEGNDLVQGDSGNDILDGGAGADTLMYENSSAAVYVNLTTGEAQGGDAAGDVFSNFEALYGSFYADTLLGAAGRETLFGYGGADSILGQDGGDLLLGGAGNDTLDGGVGTDLLRGGADADLLLGGAGNDTLRGDAGADTLVGGGGADLLFGGAGYDIFRFTAVADSGTTAGTRDRIADFVQGQDKIDLVAIDAIAGAGTANDTFSFIGTADFTAAGQVRYSAFGSNTLVAMNTTGTTGAEMQILLIGTYTLAGSDFNL